MVPHTLPGCFKLRLLLWTSSTIFRKGYRELARGKLGLAVRVWFAPAVIQVSGCAPISGYRSQGLLRLS